MKPNTTLKPFLLSTATAASLALAFSGTSAAQEDETAVQDTVVVTGSRIPLDSNLTSSTPIQSLSEDDFRLSGEINLADVVNDIPALVSSTTGENSATGANALNLRGLGDERTLTLVNGRRHVAGFRGTAAVDVGTIPRALVERVEVTTGGASAVYGADAVTGVVNFILKDDFEGFQLDLRGGISGEGDAENLIIDALYGLNFDNGKGNVVLTATYEDDSNITYGDRDWSRDNGIDTTETNPASLTDPNAPSRAVISDPRFWLTSQEGSIAPGFGGRGTNYVDINNNSIPDCQESEGGRTGFLAGCWLTNPDGTVRVNQDGTVLNGLWGIGGDGGRLNFNRDTLFPETDRFVFNLNSNYEISETMEFFFEGKYAKSESSTFGEQDTFYDTLFIQPDNPFIPEQLQPVVAVTGGLLLTQDPLDFSDNNPFKFTRETYRFVSGIEWEPFEGHIFELSANYGNFQLKSEETGLYLDRIFAAIDVTRDEDGNIVCRSDIDPTAAYEIDYFTAGNDYADGAFSSDRYYSFTPGDGQCAPLNPFGTYSVSAAAQNFITAPLEDNLEVEQTVISALGFGEFDKFKQVLDGPLGYAAGLEYREEKMRNQLDPLTLGILPEGSSFSDSVGQDVNTVDPFLNSFISIDNIEQFDTSGKFDVLDAFLEVRLPVLLDRTFAKQLTLDAAVRVSDYSTVGETVAWKIGGTYAPIDDISFRAVYSEAVRAPNIAELFDPPLPIEVNATEDICDAARVGENVNYEANCETQLLAAGVDISAIRDGDGNYIWDNPLTGRFTGVSGGNPNLIEETAETLTIGFVLTPRFLDGFSLTLDYWDVNLEDGIAALTFPEVISGCNGASPSEFSSDPTGFCDNLGRRSDGGLNFADLELFNLSALTAKGYDFSANYSFDIGQNSFGASLVGSKQEELNFNNDPELREIQRPEWSGNLTLTYDRGPLAVAFQTTYQSEQAVDEIEDVLGLGDSADLYGADGFFDETYIFDINASYDYSDKYRFYGGINNIADEEPFSTETAWPVGPRGRYFFVGVTYTH